MTLQAMRPLLHELLLDLRDYQELYQRIRQKDPAGDDLGHGALSDLVERVYVQSRIVLERSRSSRSGSRGTVRPQPAVDPSTPAPDESTTTAVRSNRGPRT